MIRLTLLASALLATSALVDASFAAELREVGTIDVPGEKLANFDIGFVDQTTAHYYLADRSNKGIDVFDTATDKYVSRMGSFVGVVKKDGKVDNDASGPDGVVVVGKEIWAGDGDSTIKVLDPTSEQTLTTIRTGGQTRVDEMAYDPKDKLFVGVNNAEDPPFATVVSANPDHAIIGKIAFPDAGDGLEQPAYNPGDGLFYISVPQVGKDPAKGAVAVVDPKTATLVRTLPVDGCHPAGLAFGSDGDFLLGCSSDGKDMPPITVIMNVGTGRVAATVPGLAGADMVNYNAKNGQYYTASRDNPGGPVIGVIDAKTRKLVQTIPLPGGNPHSVASSEATGHVYVPVGSVSGGDGKIHIFAPTP